VVYFAMRNELEWVAVVRVAISAGSALFGIQMVRALQIGLERRNLEGSS
jgi:hypothetical protein